MRYIPLLCVLMAGSASAQVEDSDRPHYYNRLYSGIIAGGKHGIVTGTVTTIHGVSVGPVAVGAGIGIEGYDRWRAVPIFGSLSYHLNDARESSWFLQINAGHSITRLLAPNDFINVHGTHGGFMFSTVVGYQAVAGKLLVNLSAGYKMQKFEGAYSGGLANLYYTLEEQTDRFVFQIGVGLP